MNKSKEIKHSFSTSSRDICYFNKQMDEVNQCKDWLVELYYYEAQLIESEKKLKEF